MHSYTSSARARHGKVFGAATPLYTPTSPQSPTTQPDFTPRRVSRGSIPVPKAARLLKRYGAVLVVLGCLVLLWNLFGADRHAHRRALYALDRRRRLSSIQRHRVWPGWEGVNKIYAFGDSHSSTGFSPSGTQPSAFNPIGNPFWPGRTANFGPNYLSHLTGTFNESFIRTYSLASADSVIVKREGVTVTAPTLEEQVEELFFHHYGRSLRRNRHNAKSGWSQQETLFVFAPGTDDIVSEFIDREGDRNLTEVSLMFDEYHKNLDRVYEYGARNFLILGFPQMEESPLMQMADTGRSPFTFGGELVDLNGRLAFLAHQFAESHADAAVFFFDTYAVGVDLHNDHTAFPETADLKRIEGYCELYAEASDILNTNERDCEHALHEFYWRDESHQTEPYHRLMARLIAEELKSDGNILPFEFF